MTAINMNQPATDSTDTWPDYTADSNTLPDFSALTSAFNKFNKMIDDFFPLVYPPQIPFYDIPRGVIFSGSPHKKVQIKRRILEYQAKY